MKLLKIWPYKMTVVHISQPHDLDGSWFLQPVHESEVDIHLSFL